MQVPEAFDKLIASVEQALTHAIVVEEKIPLSTVTNFEEIASDIRAKLADLQQTPCRMENPIIYHLDVGMCLALNDCSNIYQLLCNILIN